MTKGSNTQMVCIAVLPFENLSDNREHDYFSRGFVEDLITDLSHFPSLQVISSYTSRKIGAKTQDELAVARELAIDYLLRGNLRRQGDQIRIHTQLLDAFNGSILWAERYDAPLDTIFDIQDDIVERVVGALSVQIDKALLAAARKKPLTSLAVYDCWLRGMEHLRQGTRAADQEARQIFNQATAIDPNYSRAYAGLSLSYFNEWSCQLWEQWEETERNAYNYAMQAIQLDDTDHIVQMIVGRILMYRRQFDLAEQHLDKSLALNANDADSLAQIATSKAFLGKAREGERLFLKALRLNPYRNIWYHPYGSFTYFVQRQYDACIQIALKGPLTDVWVDLPGYIAAAYAYTGDKKEAARYLEIFERTFQKEITSGRRPQPDEIVSWVMMANPFKHDADMDHLVDGIVLAGLDYTRDKSETAPAISPLKTTPLSPGVFKKDNDLWHMAFEGSTVRISEVKGFLDLAQLLARPGAEVHCTDLMGSPVSSGDREMVMDEKARHSYEQRIRDLQADITETEQMNDFGRTEILKAELDQLTEHLSKALGIGRRTRELNAPVERARAAVTWRIRSAIRKIEATHPSLGRHLANSIRTGTFCSYSPEKDQAWHT
jgi:TolB-like protein